MSNFYHAILLADGTEQHHFISTKPMGVYRIANVLRENNYRVLVIEMYSSLKQHELYAFLARVVSDKTMFVGYSSTLFIPADRRNGNFLPGTDQEFTELNAYLKTLNKNLRIVLGGAASKYFARKVYLENNSFGIDYIFHGLGEQMILDFANNIANNRTQRFSSKITVDPLRHVNSKTKSGVYQIEYDRFGSSYNFHDSVHTWHDDDCVMPNESLPLEVSRGCSFKCKFCSYPLIGRDSRDMSYIRTEENILSEILSNYERFGTTTYTIVDDTFNERLDKLEMMARVRDRSKIDLNFVGFNRIELIARKPEQLALLKAMNFNGMTFGIESLHRPSAASIGKGMDPEEIKDTLYKLRETFDNKIFITGGFIIGLPHETPETFEKWSSWVDDPACPIDLPTYSPLNINFITDKSEFSENPGKYGYTIINSGTGWKNDYWDFDTCRGIAIEKLRTDYDTGRGRVGAFHASGLIKFGYTFDFMYGRSVRDILPQIPWSYKIYRDAYFSKLFNLPG